jgi:polyhydroxyalkanoate synthase
MVERGPSHQLKGGIKKAVDKLKKRGVNGWKVLTSPPKAGGVSKKVTIAKRGTMNLDHYMPTAKEVYRTPLFFVMATTNRSYILDLLPGQSMIEYLLGRGYDIYVLDWTEPSVSENHLQIEDYVSDFIPHCINLIKSRSGEQAVSLIGYCMGGVLALIFAALDQTASVRNLVCITTPYNWSKWGVFNVLSDARYFEIDSLVNRFGNIPADVIVKAVKLLRPASRIFEPIRLLDNLWNDDYLRSSRAFDKWGEDSLSLPGEYARQVTNDLLIDNRLYEGTLEIGGQLVDVNAITVPFLQVVAEHDHIVNREATQDLMRRIGSTDKEEVSVKGGHVSVAAGGSAVKRLWPALDKWLEPRSI